MRLGMYIDMRNPARWPRPWAEHYRRWLDRNPGLPDDLIDRHLELAFCELRPLLEDPEPV